MKKKGNMMKEVSWMYSIIPKKVKIITLLIFINFIGFIMIVDNNFILSIIGGLLWVIVCFIVTREVYKR